jgi:NAD(P)H-dependent FMN reductase
MPKLHVLTVSTRPTRKGPAVAAWATQFARSHGKFEVEPVDLASFGLPVFDEPEHPSKQAYVNEHTKAWSRSVAAADAFVFVIPEYDHHMPSSLVNAMQYLYKEWTYKPVAFVSYAGVSGGMRSVETARLFCTGFKMVPLVEGVILTGFDKKIDKDGVFLSDEIADKSATAMLDELLRWTDAMKVLRQG